MAVKHALHTGWHFSAAQKQQRSGTLSDRRALPLFACVEDFWVQVAHIAPPSALPVGTTLYLFRSGLEPCWEDFPDGGAWTNHLVRETTAAAALDATWEELSLATIGEQLHLTSGCDGDEEVLGCELSVRKTHAKLALWTRHGADEASQRAIARRMRGACAAMGELSYVAHSTKRRETRARRTSGGGGAAAAAAAAGAGGGGSRRAGASGRARDAHGQAGLQAVVHEAEPPLYVEPVPEPAHVSDAAESEDAQDGLIDVAT